VVLNLGGILRVGLTFFRHGGADVCHLVLSQSTAILTFDAYIVQFMKTRTILQNCLGNVEMCLKSELHWDSK